MKASLAPRVRKFILEISAFAESNDFLDLVKFDFLDLANFATDDRFSIFPPTSLLISPSVPPNVI